MGLAVLVIGLALFLAPHTLTAFRQSRQVYVDRFGLGTYKAVYSVVSLIGVLVAGYGFGLYRATGWIDVWYPPVWLRHLSVLLVWPAIVFMAAAYSPGRIKTALKHPFMVGVKLWALAHLLANGDLGSIVLFGAILAWAVFDRISLKRRTDPGSPAIPVGGAQNDVIAVAVGTVAYILLALYFHPYVVGVDLLPG
ncbi:MAG: NnrU family protein [Alphaproteobacteria bacterium]|nr:NnrU family protein [Alphaproteobacteria bacterium]